MPQFYSRLVTDKDQDSFLNETGFWHDNEIAIFSYSADNGDQTLNSLAFKVRRNPKDLLSHLRRIYFCHQASLSKQLYAALLDLLIVLQGKGQAIGKRMLYGSRQQIDEHQFKLLEHAVKSDYDKLGNRYSLFTSGQIGTCELLEQHQTEVQHDFLILANDFIEYSQLDQAMDVLETGINLNPDRIDLQEALLELYKSTENRTRFQSSYKSFLAAGISLIDDWQRMTHYFEGKS